MSRPVAAAVCLVLAVSAFSQAQVQSPDAAVAAVRTNAKFKQAMAVIDRDHAQLVSDIVSLTEIPSPPFKEDKRAAAFLAMFRAAGLTSVERDAEGNVLGLRKGTGGGPLIAVSAHLDTVFPEGTDVTVKRQGTRLSAPGIGDDTRSLAVMLAMIRAMNAAGIQTASDILFVGDVGEEGPGDLRGMRQLFTRGAYKDRIKMFIAIDGAGSGAEITNGGIGVRRYRVTFKGPGGHSYSAFGLVNPAFAMGNASAKLSKVAVPATPKTTFNIGVVGGGTSINSIPNQTWMDVDMRSESPAELAKLEKTFLGLMQQAADEENAARSTASGKITVEAKLTGNRPPGQTPMASPLVQTAAAAIRAMGMMPEYRFGSTDSNIPISLGIPAITIDSGGAGGDAHALTEWIDVEKTQSVKGIETALLILLAAAGI